MQDQAAEILDLSVPSENGIALATAFVEKFAFTTTALAAIARALDGMGSERQGETIRAFLSVLAEVEAKEV